MCKAKLVNHLWHILNYFGHISAPTVTILLPVISQFEMRWNWSGDWGRLLLLAVLWRSCHGRERSAEEAQRKKGGWLDWCGLDLVSAPLCYTQWSSRYPGKNWIRYLSLHLPRHEWLSTGPTVPWAPAGSTERRVAHTAQHGARPHPVIGATGWSRHWSHQPLGLEMSDAFSSSFSVHLSHATPLWPNCQQTLPEWLLHASRHRRSPAGDFHPPLDPNDDSAPDSRLKPPQTCRFVDRSCSVLCSLSFLTSAVAWRTAVSHWKVDSLESCRLCEAIYFLLKNIWHNVWNNWCTLKWQMNKTANSASIFHCSLGAQP